VRCERYGQAGQHNLTAPKGHPKVYGKDQIRYLRCRVCGSEFRERKRTALWNTKGPRGLPEAKAVAVAEHLAEGCSLKGTARLVRVDPSPVRRLNQRLGEQGQAFHDERVQVVQYEADALNKVPTGVSSIGFTAVCLGIARGALDAFIELAATKSLGGGKGKVRDNPVVQDQVGRAEATLRAARAYLYETIREEWESMLKTGFCTRKQHSLLRLAATHAATLSAQVVDTTWNAAGASAIFAGNPIERRFRDIHVATQNAAIRSEYYVGTGQMFLGLDQE
jgi:hypothetical protein